MQESFQTVRIYGWEPQKYSHSLKRNNHTPDSALPDVVEVATYIWEHGPILYDRETQELLLYMYHYQDLRLGHITQP